MGHASESARPFFVYFETWYFIGDEDIWHMYQKLFILFVFLLPVQTVWIVREVFIGGEKWQYGTVGVYGTDILLVLSFVLALASKKFRERVQRDGIFWILLLFSVWAFLSVFWARDPFLAFFGAAAIALGLGVFLLARSLPDIYARWVLGAVVAAAVFESMLGIGQFLSQHIAASTLFGISEYEPWRAGVSVVKAEGARWLRSYGTMPHPNMLGGFLAAALSMLSICIVRPHDALDSRLLASLSRSGRGNDKILYGVSIVILLGLLLTFSRSAWAGVILSFGVLAFFVYRKGKAEQRKQLLKTAAVLLFATAVFTGILGEVVFPRFDEHVIVREGSLSQRTMSFEDGRRVIGDHFFLGAGAGNETAEILASDGGREVWSVQPPHNVPMLVWAQLGAVGASILFIAFARAAKIALRNIRRGDTIALTSSLALLALGGAFLVDHWLWTSHFGLLFFFLLVGLSAREQNS